MSIWILIQIGLFTILFGIVAILWVRLLRQGTKDDPRLSKGLQLLQSKISVLEDLSDRTDEQVRQLIGILEQKCGEIQRKITDADKHIHLIASSMEKSLDVAKIFQDKIPHKEIIERKNTAKYVQAARLAHNGANIDEISEEIDLPKAEIELIMKINKNKLMFSSENLPPWVEKNSSDQPREKDFSKAFEVPHFQNESLTELGNQFRQACKKHNQKSNRSFQSSYVLKNIMSTLKQNGLFIDEDSKPCAETTETNETSSQALDLAPPPIEQEKENSTSSSSPDIEIPPPSPSLKTDPSPSASSKPSSEIKKVVFPKLHEIELNKNLG